MSDQTEKNQDPHLRPWILAGAAAALALGVALGLFPAPPARAQSPTPIFVPAALVPVQPDTPLELVALTLDAQISESNGHTLISGNSTFKIHNTDPLNDLQVPVGFPAWVGDPYVFDPSQLSDFSVSVDGQKVRTLNPSRADLKIGNTVRTVDWYTFTLTIAGGEKKTVRYDFTQDLGDGLMPRLTYGMTPATDWKGSIGSARITLHFPEMTTLDQLVAFDPPDPDFDGTEITWLFTNKEPPANPTVTFLRPSLYDDLNARRLAAQQNPNDATTRAALGNLLRQLALVDSPRSDSFYAQAVAELETAVRFDPNQRSARQSLAALYESRAGPASGPRQSAYVSLAITQWEALAAGDANARKQLAEDYFYLGLDAQTRQAFADAAVFYDKAQSLAPGGAGPLFAPDRGAAQRRALNVAWARALLDQNDVADAMEKARAAFGDTFVGSLPPPAFAVTRAQVTMSPNSRVMLFSLEPFGTTPEELQNLLSGAAAQLHANGANASFDPSAAVLNITLSFNNRAELTDRLAGVATSLPSGSEWALVRAVSSPQNVDWQDTDRILTHVSELREDADLSSACAEFTAQIDAISKNLAPLDNASANDDEAQLKRALMKYAQSGWQTALAQGSVVYQVGGNTTRAEPCASRTITQSASSFLPLRVAAIVAGIEVIGIGVLVIRWRRRKMPAQRGTAAKG